MEITGLNKYCHTNVSSKKAGTEAFRTEVLNWKEKIMEKINEDLENDRKGNINMSEKNWNAFMNRVDIAVNTFSPNVKTDVKADYSRPDEEDKRLCDDYFTANLKEKEKFQLNVTQIMEADRSKPKPKSHLINPLGNGIL
nr:hypothetical protein [uncultured Clostridium sp.]